MACGAPEAVIVAIFSYLSIRMIAAAAGEGAPCSCDRESLPLHGVAVDPLHLLTLALVRGWSPGPRPAPLESLQEGAAHVAVPGAAGS
jgi:hypothetical protein